MGVKKHHKTRYQKKENREKKIVHCLCVYCYNRAVQDKGEWGNQNGLHMDDLVFFSSYEWHCPQ